MQNITDIIKELNKDRAIILSGFALGFLWTFKANKKTLKYPLSTIFNGSINGFFCSIGALIVGIFIPFQIRFIIPMACASSIVYSKVNDLTETDTKTHTKTHCNSLECHCGCFFCNLGIFKISDSNVQTTEVKVEIKESMDI